MKKTNFELFLSDMDDVRFFEGRQELFEYHTVFDRLMEFRHRICLDLFQDMFGKEEGTEIFTLYLVACQRDVLYFLSRLSNQHRLFMLDAIITERFYSSSHEV